jgi:hypothetical protein
MSGIKEVFGGAAFWTDGQGLAEPSTLKRVLDILVFHYQLLSVALEC